MEERWINTGDLWMDKARSLQLRVRERFRVTVDRQRHRPRFYYRSYFSSTSERWLLRFLSFRRDSLPSSTFYHKRVGMDVEEEGSILTRVLQSVAVPVIGNVCHVFMHGLNRVQIYGAEKLHEALLHRGKNKPLITVSNHIASMDDPLVIASLLPASVLFDAHSLRWTLCASDRCFRNPATSAFFKCVKVLPISRGEGIYQKGMDMAISKLNQGGWVHIFPEGTRSRDGGKTMGSAKRGIGRLVLDADAVPLVIPFVHTGMQEIMPVGAKIPRIGKTITVLIGDPIEFEDLCNAEENHYLSRGKLYDAVSARIGDRLKKLKDQVDRLAIEKSLKLQNYSWKCTERAAGILQNIDWEALGMDGYFGADADSLSLQKNSPNEMGRNGVLNLQENDSPDQYFRTGFSYGGGIVSRIQGCMDPTDFMGFAARGLFMKREVRENFASVQEVSPLKAWNNLWKLMYQNCISI